MSEPFDRPSGAPAPAEQGGAPGQSNEAMRRQLHALHVSQLELEMQSAALAELQLLKDEFETGLNHYSELYEQAPVSYFSLQRGGRIARVNEAAAALLRRAKSQLLGRNFEQFVAPEAQRRFRRFLDAVFASGARQVLEITLLQGVTEAELVRIEANVDPASDVCRMVVTDLGDPVAREVALRRAFVVLDAIKEGVLIADASNHIISVNPAFTAITGYLAEEAIGRRPDFLASGTQPPEFFADMRDSLSRHGSWQGEILSRKKDGSRFVESLSLTQMPAPDGGVGNYVGVFSDITERKLAETALRELHLELDQRVVARTAELLRANQQLHQEIGERQRAEVALRDAEHFFHATIDSLSDRVLVLDQRGTIIHANKSCLDFAGHSGIGNDYLPHCETDARWGRGAGAELAAGIRGVIAGTQGGFALEYAFHAGGAARWFQAKVSRFLSDGPLRVVVSHTDITERKAMEGALRQSHAQLRQLALHLETAKEDERKRISRDIHDELGQNLLALRIDISMLSARTEHAHPRLHGRVGAVLGNVDKTIKSVRGIMNALRPLVLDLGLQAAMEWQIGDFTKRSGIPCRLLVRDEALFGALGGDIEIVVFRIVQEALSNVLRHAQARHAEIELSVDTGALTLAIRDDGVGIAPAQRRKAQCFGLIGIDERVSALGGRFSIGKFSDGQGCQLTMRIPLSGRD
ncbi:PAS domain S-box protein [Janthinobacterium fluminis]|uniref:PAS domain S-box protein n=1 Tax=Janthinobacterium fluminis TaxID=2987524 RepID=A0ABT5JTU1_9BURK|nr:PAS domain S-box protein [Janthinobacterium fluminis]MDC8756123.1 PAS domain S-box protein [Janthinobacterium fluminis]